MRALALLTLTLAIAGCSQPAPTPAQSTAGAPAAVASASGVAACNGVDPADVQPLLSAAITSAKANAGDANVCVFSTDGYSSISVTVRPSGGQDTLKTWHKGPAQPLPGVGDDAVFEPDLKEVVAAHGDTLCTVTAMGGQSSGATAQTEGALCAKIFARR